MHRFLLPLLLALPLGAQSANFLSLDDYVTDWKISKQFTVAVAQKMPAGDYSFKATPEEMSFGEQMIHISLSLFIRFAEVSGEKPPVNEAPPKITKDMVLSLLNRSYDYAIETLPKLTNKQLQTARFKVNFEGRPTADLNGREMLMNMLVHAAHHRAQCEVYLRLKGIAPPTYTF